MYVRISTRTGHTGNNRKVILHCGVLVIALFSLSGYLLVLRSVTVLLQEYSFMRGGPIEGLTVLAGRIPCYRTEFSFSCSAALHCV